MTTQERAMAAAEKYLEAKGYEIVESIDDKALVATMCGDYFINKVDFDFGKFPSHGHDREFFEGIMLELIGLWDGDMCGVVPCFIDINIVNEGRAILRHKKNCLG